MGALKKSKKFLLQKDTEQTRVLASDRQTLSYTIIDVVVSSAGILCLTLSGEYTSSLTTRQAPARFPKWNHNSNDCFRFSLFTT